LQLRAKPDARILKEKTHMSNIAEAWVKSGKHAEIVGFKLRPIENPFIKGTPLIAARGQAQAFYLTDDNNLGWILKKFLPAKIPDSGYMKSIESLIPHRPGFQSGYLRRVLSKGDISKAGFYNADFTSWIENTVLMPQIKHDDWATLADRIRSGSARLTKNDRMLLCQSVSEEIKLLEGGDISHRDLSPTNVFVDAQNSTVHLIDWDCIFHPSLSMPPNTTYGTNGYIAPFIKEMGALDPQKTWMPRADRFSLAILNAEFLGMDVGTPLKHDGGMFEQAELFNRGGPETFQIINQLRQSFPGAAVLLERALQAQSFDDCPSPAEWIGVSTSASVTSFNVAPAFMPGVNSIPNTASIGAPMISNTFALLDEAAFVQLDESAFAPLY
jgi:Serine/threonine protein kinase